MPRGNRRLPRGLFSLHNRVWIVSVCLFVCAHKWNSIYLEIPFIFICADIFQFIKKFPLFSFVRTFFSIYIEIHFIFTCADTLIAYPLIFRIFVEHLEFLPKNFLYPQIFFFFNFWFFFLKLLQKKIDTPLFLFRVSIFFHTPRFFFSIFEFFIQKFFIPPDLIFQFLIFFRQSEIFLNIFFFTPRFL